MFCPKCGAQVAEGVSFCSKCGTMIRQEVKASGFTGSAAMLTSGMVQKKSGKKNLLLVPLMLVGVGIIVVGLMVGKLFLGTGKEEPVNQKKSFSKDKEEDFKKELTELTIDTPTVLEGNYENLETIISNGAQVTLDGEFPSLSKVVMKPGDDGTTADFVFEYGTRFPVLTHFQGGAIVTQNYTEDGFDLEAFQAAQSMEFYAKNSEVDEEWLMMLSYAKLLQNAGVLTHLDYKVSHELSDLYGTWTNEKRTMMLTFQEDGTVRVAESMNLIGVDLLVFTEVDENTLSLKTKNYAENMLFGIISELVSFYMDYELLGDKLYASFQGMDFELNRIK